MARRVGREPVTADRPGLGCAGLQHAEPPPEDPEGEHRGSRIAGSAAPPDRHRAGKRHRFERTGKGASRSRAKRSGTPASMAARSGALAVASGVRTNGTTTGNSSDQGRTRLAAQDPHPLPGRRIGHSPRRGIDEKTLEIRAAEITTSHVGDAPCGPGFPTRSPPIRSAPASPPPLTVCKQTVAGQWTGPLTLASAMMPSAPAALPRSYRPDRMPSLGSRTPPGRSHATKPSGHQNASAGRSGDDGAAITAGAASKPRCTV